MALEQQHLPLGRLQLLQQHVSLDEPDLPYRRRNHGRHGARRHRTPATPGEVRLGLYAQCQHRQELVYPPQYTLGFSLDVKNILNNQDIKTGGYEQTRLSKNTETTVTTYQAFDSKYFYMFGTTYYLNLYFRF